MENSYFNELNVFAYTEEKDTALSPCIWCLLSRWYFVQAVPYTLFSLPLLSLLRKGHLTWLLWRVTEGGMFAQWSAGHCV